MCGRLPTGGPIVRSVQASEARPPVPILPKGAVTYATPLVSASPDMIALIQAYARRRVRREENMERHEGVSSAESGYRIVI